MTDSTHINPNSILVAIDIAKQNHDALILWPSGHKKVIRIPNTLEGYQQLLKATHALPAEITIGFEPTADYHRNVAFWFKHQGAQCMLALHCLWHGLERCYSKPGINTIARMHG